MLTTFNPVNYSNAENEFLLTHLGESRIIALRSIKSVAGPRRTESGAIDKNPVLYPDGVIPAAVKPILETVFELYQLEQHDGTKWAGINKIKDAITVWLTQNAKW